MKDISALLKSAQGKKTAILTAGNDMRADDGAGPLIIRTLSGKTKASLFDGGELPENLAFKIIQLNPEMLFIIDAANMDKEPGHIAVINEKDISGPSFSSHRMPLSMLTGFITKELPGIKVIIIGIQPQGTELGKPMSAAVRNAVNKLSGLFTENEI